MPMGEMPRRTYAIPLICPRGCHNAFTYDDEMCFFTCDRWRIYFIDGWYVIYISAWV
jgi:hypothetical protein